MISMESKPAPAVAACCIDPYETNLSKCLLGVTDDGDQGVMILKARQA
jgi:hypothetical protein